MNEIRHIIKNMYRLKHIPTGLYYQPGENNLSTTGKVYFTNSNVMSSCYSGGMIEMQVRRDGQIHKKYSHLSWESVSYKYGKVKIVTKISDWVKEYIANDDLYTNSQATPDCNDTKHES